MPQINEQISKIISNLKSSWGDDFYSHLLLQLNSVIQADYLFIAKLNEEKTVSTTICLVAGETVGDNFSYELAKTPCADVSNDSVCVYSTGICQLYPQDKLLVDMGIDAYIGTPIYESSGKVIGIIVALYSHKISDSDWIVNLFTLFSGRIAAEIERQNKENELIQLNEELESIVAERTRELSASLEHLKNTQEKLVEQEKMASLGSLVAGVAHEINTPLGVAILCNSNIGELARNLHNKTNNNTLTKNDLLKLTNGITKSQQALSMNLDRAADLVADFKLVAVERSLDDLSIIEINTWFDTLLSSLRLLIEKQQIKLKFIKLPASRTIETIPSKLAQVVTNLVTNAINHAFEEKNNNSCIVIALAEANDRIIIEIKDNGIGMEEDILKDIFNPFFTTKRGSGGTGLGLNIVYGIVNGSLAGEIEVKSTPHVGSSFIVNLPNK